VRVCVCACVRVCLFLWLCVCRHLAILEGTQMVLQEKEEGGGGWRTRYTTQDYTNHIICEKDTGFTVVKYGVLFQ